MLPTVASRFAMDISTGLSIKSLVLMNGLKDVGDQVTESGNL
jgi:hypothetical protein